MEKARILIVEDEELVGLSIQASLEEIGHLDSRVETSGEAALVAVPEFAPDLVLMDIHLAGSMSGTEAARIIGETFRIPVVYLTAYSDDQTLEEAKRAEPYGYLVKPFDEKSLRTTIEIALFKSALEGEIRRGRQASESILQSVGEAIVVAGPTCLVEYMNQKAESLLGPMSANRTKSLLSLFTLNDAATQAPQRLDIVPVIFEGRSSSLRNCLVSALGREPFLADIDLVPFRDENGTARGLIMTLRKLAPLGS